MAYDECGWMGHRSNGFMHVVWGRESIILHRCHFCAHKFNLLLPQLKYVLICITPPQQCPICNNKRLSNVKSTGFLMQMLIGCKRRIFG
jgi:hypothetical protein